MVRVAVLGCGLLGVKIAGEFAYHGHRVKCYDNNIQALNSVYQRYQSDKVELLNDQIVDSLNFTGQVLCMSRIEETVNDAQLIIECVVEDFDVKSNLLEKISFMCPSECIIVTTTLRIDILKLSEKIKNKERFIGLRFLYPVYYIPEVEITPYKDSANWVVEKLRTLLSHMGKTLFFRSGIDPLILTEEQREMRKEQKITELRNNSMFSPINSREPNLPDLGRNTQTEINRLFLKRNPNVKDFFSFQKETSRTNANNSGSKKAIEKKFMNDELEMTNENDCAICMDSIRNSVLRPCNHMVTCYGCSLVLHNRNDNCPVCREKITDVIKIFMS